MNEHIAALTAEIAGSVKAALNASRGPLGVDRLPWAWQREFENLPDKIVERVVEGLLSNGFHIRHLKPAGKVDVQASETGSFSEAPFSKEVRVLVSLGDFGIWHATRFHRPGEIPLDYAARMFADGLAGTFSEQVAPVVAAGLSELNTDAFGKD